MIIQYGKRYRITANVNPACYAVVIVLNNTNKQGFYNNFVYNIYDCRIVETNWMGLSVGTTEPFGTHHNWVALDEDIYDRLATLLGH